MVLKVAFLDCDGTLTKVKSSWEYIHRRLNIWNDMADEYQRLFRAGMITYQEFCERDAILWKAMPLERLWDIIQEIEYQDYAREFVEFLKSINVYTVIVSTGISAVVEKVKRELGIDMALSNELLSHNGYLTGETKIHVEYNKKDMVIKEILKGLGFNKSHAFAVGDGEGDGGLFESVGVGIRLVDNMEGIEETGDIINCNSLYHAKIFLERYIKKEMI